MQRQKYPFAEERYDDYPTILPPRTMYSNLGNDRSIHSFLTAIYCTKIWLTYNRAHSKSLISKH